MELTCCEKLTYYWHYLKYRCNLKRYKSVIIINNDKTSINIADMFNNKSISDEKFNNPTKVIVNYVDEKEFIASFYSSSYKNIKQIIKKIAEDDSSYNKKLKTFFPNFIENIYFVIKNNDNNHEPTNENEINIKNTINECLDYEKNNITFFDVALLVCDDIKKIDKIKVVYVKKFRKHRKEFNFSEYIDKDIEILNSIYEDEYNDK